MRCCGVVEGNRCHLGSGIGATIVTNIIVLGSISKEII